MREETGPESFGGAGKQTVRNKASKVYPFKCSLSDDALELSYSNNTNLIRVTANPLSGSVLDSVDIYLDRTQIGMLISALATMKDQLT